MNCPIKVGVSACLLGEPVRYDGGHRRNPFIADTLGRFFEFVPVCPEVGCGLWVPRETMRLVGDPGAPRLMTTQTDQDHTDRMRAWTERRVAELAGEDLSGFIFKSGSPSCGWREVKVYDDQGMAANVGQGLFAGAFMVHSPLVPVEDEDRLQHPVWRENFVERLVAQKRWRDLSVGKKTLGRLVDFHSVHKLLILAHSQKEYRLMGKLLAQGKSLAPVMLYSDYQSFLIEALRQPATPENQVNVLHHVMGYFKRQLSSDEKQKLLEDIDEYRQGLVPLTVPMTSINNYVHEYRQPYLSRQVYLNPDPIEIQIKYYI
ncbi:MAG: DUF523 and DUF1722 domain-containing protein [Deltaproteobacteria bacterium]|nr:DUF523 and DUF1722 domain-containing protein [Deltaproteobacteria bacterium]